MPPTAAPSASAGSSHFPSYTPPSLEAAHYAHGHAGGSYSFAAGHLPPPVLPPPVLPQIGMLGATAGAYSQACPVGLSQPHVAAAYVDRNHNGCADYLYVGVDRNHDGIPDALEQQAQTVAPVPVAAAYVDSNHDGRADSLYVGVDRNRDGVPDALQAPPQTSVHPPLGTCQSTSSRPASPPGSPMLSMRALGQVSSAGSLRAPSGWGSSPSMKTEAVSPVTAQLAATIEHRKHHCAESLAQHYALEGKRINEINWAQREEIRRRAQAQKDAIDKQAEAAMSNLDARRNAQVMGLQQNIYSQRAQLEQEATKAAVDCYMQFEQHHPEIWRTQQPPIAPPPQHNGPPHLAPAEVYRSAELAHQVPPQKVQPMIPPNLGFPPGMRMWHPPVLQPAPQMFLPEPLYSRQVERQVLSTPRASVVEVVESLNGQAVSGSPQSMSPSAFRNSVQVVAEEKDDVDEFGRHSTRRVFSISGMDGEPLAIVQMLK